MADKELTFEEIDEWVRQKYCLFCTMRSRGHQLDKMEQEFHKKAEDVFKQMITVQPQALDTPEKVEKMFQTIMTIVTAGGRVIVVVGT